MKRKASCLESGESSSSTSNSSSPLSSRRAFIRASNRGTLKRAGPYLLGPRLGNSPVRSIVQCLAKKEGTDDFYSIKILTLADPGRESYDDKQGKMLLHTEYSLLSLLNDQDGVVHHHGLFKDEYYEEVPLEKDSANSAASHRSQNACARQFRIRHRLCLVLDCLCAHDFSSETADLINLQHYVIREKRLSERETIIIFHDIVRVVECLHKVRIQSEWIFGNGLLWYEFFFFFSSRKSFQSVYYFNRRLEVPLQLSLIEVKLILVLLNCVFFNSNFIISNSKIFFSFKSLIIRGGSACIFACIFVFN